MTFCLDRHPCNPNLLLFPAPWGASPAFLSQITPLSRDNYYSDFHLQRIHVSCFGFHKYRILEYTLLCQLSFSYLVCEVYPGSCIFFIAMCYSTACLYAIYFSFSCIFGLFPFFFVYYESTHYKCSVHIFWGHM